MKSSSKLGVRNTIRGERSINMARSLISRYRVVAMKRLLTSFFKPQESPPRRLITDKLKSYGIAKIKILKGKGLNVRA